MPQKPPEFYNLTLISSALMILIFILQLSLSITDFLALNTSQILQEPWTIITSGFAHSSISHITNNLLFFVLFGIILERIIGSKKFLIFFLLSIIVANLSAFIFYPGVNVLGASGAVSSFLVALAVYRPRMMGLYWGVPMRMYLVLIFWLITNLLISTGNSNIAAEAHLFGGFFGLLAGIYLRQNYPEKKEKHEKGINLSDREIDKWERSYMD